MTTLSYQTIKRLNLITPMEERTKLNGVTYGLGPCGYDVRIKQNLFILPSLGKLASTIEYFKMPINVKAEVKDKSTWARRFICVQNTFIEPGWEGYLTLEITNHTLWPIRIKAGTPIAQIVFEFLDEPTAFPYNGKYQHQEDKPVEAIYEK